ncbi:MAG: glycosyltransferase [Deltaproteobacteria bacterium]|nr:glycosyltransferase [Deltaproteobacteria bacterium]
MIRILICGIIEPAWRKEAEAFLTRDKDDYEKGVAAGNLPKEDPRLPRVLPLFVEEEDRVGGQLNQFNPQIIISIQTKPKPLLLMSLHDRMKWHHFAEAPAPANLKQTIFEGYLSHALFASKGEQGQPLLSVFTPTYNPGPYLPQTYQSLTQQTYRNWEWVIVDDGSTDDTRRLISSWTTHDSRIRFFRPVDRNFGNIGRMKHYATGLCLGEVLVELDHDDLLTANALAEVAEAFAGDPELGFVYSNFAEFVEGGGDHYYPEWMDRGRYRRTLLQDRHYLEAMAYDVYGEVEGVGPVIKEMTICPNHIRAFRRSEFNRVGGYNPRLVMGDDFDLMIRFFCRSKMKHVPKLLYLYRIHSNTWARFNEFARFIFPIIAKRWEDEVDQRIEELKKNGRWLPEVQGRRKEKR